MRRLLIGLFALLATACGAQPAAVSAPATETAPFPMHAQARAMSEDAATALACERYMEAENRITLAVRGVRDFNSGTDKSKELAQRAIDANNDAYADWLAAIGSAIAVAPNNHVRAAMDQAPAFYRYWSDMGTGPNAGVGSYGYSLVLRDIADACKTAGHPMNLITDDSRPGLPKLP